MTTNFYTYVYRDPSRDMEPFYIGKGKGKRSHDHIRRTDKHPMTHRIQLMKREGVDPDIEIIHAIDESHAFFLESCLIEMFGRRDLKTGTLLNLTDGGEGPSGSVCSDKTRLKMSASQKGRTHSPETRARMSTLAKTREYSLETRAKFRAAKIGKKHTPETCAKRSESLTGLKRSPETCAKISAVHKGKIISDEMRAKISKAKKGKTLSPETCAKMSASRKGRIMSAETRAKISATRKVKCNART